LLAPRPNPQLDHPLSAVRDCLLTLYSQLSPIRNPRTRYAVVTGPTQNGHHESILNKFPFLSLYRTLRLRCYRPCFETSWDGILPRI